MVGCIYDRVASYSIHHLFVNMSCKIFKLKLNMKLDFEKRLLTSFSLL